MAESLTHPLEEPLPRPPLALPPDAGHEAARLHESASPRVSLPDILPDEDVFAYVRRVRGAFEPRLYQQVVGAANELKEGDVTIGVAAADEASRRNARALLAHTRLGDLDATRWWRTAVLRACRGRSTPRRRRAPRAGRWASSRPSCCRRARRRSTSRQGRADQRRDRLRGEADEQRGARRRRAQGVQPAARQQGGRGATWARGSSPTRRPTTRTTSAGRSSTVGVSRWATWCSAPTPCPRAPESVAAVESALHDILVTFGLAGRPAALRARARRRAGGGRGDAAGHHGHLVPEPRRQRRPPTRTFDVTLEKMLAHAAARTGR